MTPQIKLLLAGFAAFAVAKFYYHKDMVNAALIGTATMSAIAILTAHKEDK